jgi:hypothetical protein
MTPTSVSTFCFDIRAAFPVAHPLQKPIQPGKGSSAAVGAGKPRKMPIPGEQNPRPAPAGVTG